MLLHKSLNIFLFSFLFLSLTSCSGFLQKKRYIVTKVAVKQIGVKYQSGGCSPNTGFDCSGLVYYSYKMAGYNIPRTAKGQYKYSDRVFFFKKPGDLIFFNTKKCWWKVNSWYEITHVGIYLGGNKMIHAPKTGSKVTIVNNVFDNSYWKKYYINTRRILE